MFKKGDVVRLKPGIVTRCIPLHELEFLSKFKRWFVDHEKNGKVYFKYNMQEGFYAFDRNYFELVYGEEEEPMDIKTSAFNNLSQFIEKNSTNDEEKIRLMLSLEAMRRTKVNKDELTPLEKILIQQINKEVNHD